MPCTTILVGKKASYDGSTMIARNDDGNFDVKKMVVVTPDKQPKKYRSVIGHLTVDLNEKPLRYTSCPNVDLKEGIWAATGMNEANVGMTATETITTNPRVLGADPLVRYRKAKKRGEKDVPGGIGEEDLLVLVLPYIRSAREGVCRLGDLLEKYGTYESNGIAFQDENEIWWLETIGGHHWIARRVRDEECVIMPNRFGLDHFDFDDAYGKGRENLCSADLREFIEANRLDLSQNGIFNPRETFGSHSDADHVYNTPRSWYMGRYLCPTTIRWEGPDAAYTPESDDIPWAVIPEKKVTVEDVKYLLGSHFQGTPYDPYAPDGQYRYRTIGKNNTSTMSICQIRPDRPDPIKSVEWICFGSPTFVTVFPVYANADRLPAYLSQVTTDVSTDNFFWSSCLIAALLDPHYKSGIMYAEHYQAKVMSRGHEILGRYDREMTESKDFSLIAKANEELCAMAKEETQKTMNEVVLFASESMKSTFHRGDY